MVTNQNQDSACYKCEPSDAEVKSAKATVTTRQSKLQNYMHIFTFH